jgi:hypothetical protein
LWQTYHRLRNHFGRTQWYSKMTRLKLKLIFIHLKVVLIMTQDGCTVCAKRTIGLEIILYAPKLLCDVGHVKSRFGLFGDGVSVSARYNTVCGKRRNHFGCTRWFSKVTRLKWKLVSVRLEIVLILTQDRCTICTDVH